jgi:DmsE family decaheme c-type cytochrome
MIRTRSLAALLLLAVFGSAAPMSVSAEDSGGGADTRHSEDAVCTKCHDESEGKPILSIYQTPHGVTGDARTPSCKSCHGESKDHLAGNTAGGEGKRPAPDVLFGSKHSTAGYAATDPKAQTEVCLTCHKSGLRQHWPGSQHESNDVVCADCHKVHSATDPMLVKADQPTVCFTCHKEQRAQIKQISAHPLDVGKMACSDCHNPHGSPGPKLLAKNTVTETCTTCHAEKRGPFLWEHQPVNEDCTNCHTPHGSNISPLLKSRPPFLCDECHDGPHNSQAPYGTAVAGIQGGGAVPGGNPNSSAVGRACMNCHVMVHGSNSPTGAFLHH